jgi:CRISPR-associated protein Csx14
MVRCEVDQLNPNQVLACCGLAEIAQKLYPGSLSYFEGKRHFVVTGVESLQDLLSWVPSAKVERLHEVASHKLDPLLLVSDLFRLRLDWWHKIGGKGSPYKLYAGASSPIGIFNELLSGSLPFCSHPNPISAFARGRTTSWGYDSKFNGLKTFLSFTPNSLKDKEKVYTPIASLLAGIGLQGFRPIRAREESSPEDEEDEEEDSSAASSKGSLTYYLWCDPLPTIVARAAFSGLVWPYQGVQSALLASGNTTKCEQGRYI